MTPDMLQTIGRALYGEHWKTPLAAALCVSDRTMRRWINGAFEIPGRLAADLLTLVEQRAGLLAAVAHDLRAIIATLPPTEEMPT